MYGVENKTGHPDTKMPRFLIPYLFLPLILVLLIICILIFVAVAIQLDADAQHDESEPEDADAKVEEHAIPEDGGGFDAGDRDQHFGRGGCGRRSARLNFGASHTCVIGGDGLGRAIRRVYPHDGEGIWQRPIDRRLKVDGRVGRHHQRAA